MSSERFLSHSRRHTLAPLVPKSGLLTFKNNKVFVTDRIETPINELGLPDSRQLVKDVLATLSVEHYWTGIHDVHHMNWPRADYQKADEANQELSAARYRGAGTQKIRIPRQMHDYVHLTTVPTAVQDYNLMRQVSIEQSQVDRLHDTVSLKNLADFDMTEEVKEYYRLKNFREKLDDMTEGQLGIMPEINYLYDLELDEARRVLRAISKVQGFSNRKKQQKRFFNSSSHLMAA